MGETPVLPGAQQRWAAIAQGMQQDLAAYGRLRELLEQQFHAALRHDAPAMAQLAQKITDQADALADSRQLRVAHARALLPAGAALSMSVLFGLLKAPLQQQLQALWAQLEAQVQSCKALNLRNCELIMEQADLMRTVIAGGAQAEIYAPF